MPVTIGGGLTFCGRELGPEELDLIRQITRDFSTLSLTELRFKIYLPYYVDMCVARASWPSSNGKSYQSIYLRESYRDGPHVRKRDIANLTQLRPQRDRRHRTRSPLQRGPRRPWLPRQGPAVPRPLRRHRLDRLPNRPAARHRASPGIWIPRPTGAMAGARPRAEIGGGGRPRPPGARPRPPGPG